MKAILEAAANMRMARPEFLFSLMRFSRKLTNTGMIWGVIAVSTVALLPGGIVVAADEAPTLQTIIDAWENRKVPKTWRMEWTQVRTDMKGSMSIVLHEIRRNNPDAPDVFPTPTEDTMLKMGCALTVDNKRWRYDATGESWFMDQIVPDNASFAFDGTDFLEVRQFNHGEIVPYAKIHDSSGRKFWVGQATHGVSWWCWPLDVSRGGIDLATARILDERRTLDDAELIGIEKIVGSEVHQYWVDSNTFLLRLAEIRSRGKLRSVLSAEYVDVHGYLVPKSWRKESYGRNLELEQQKDCVQQEFTVSPEVSDADFHLSFPEHSVAYDLRGKTEKDYLVKSNGDLYPLQKEDHLLPHSEVVAKAESDEAEAISNLNWLVPLNVIIGLFLLVFVIRWRRQ